MFKYNAGSKAGKVWMRSEKDPMVFMVDVSDLEANGLAFKVEGKQFVTGPSGSTVPFGEFEPRYSNDADRELQYWVRKTQGFTYFIYND